MSQFKYLKYNLEDREFDSVLLSAVREDWRWLLSASDQNPISSFYEAAIAALSASTNSTVYVWGAKPRRPTPKQIDQILQLQIDAIKNSILEICGGVFPSIEVPRSSFQNLIEELLYDHKPLLDLKVRISINRKRFVRDRFRL